jgi:alpha-D-ribose 1-methylphosphonate 5-triphosphate synthase subunit PhnG
VRLTRDRQSEALMRASGNTLFVAYFSDATDRVQINVLRAVETGVIRIEVSNSGTEKPVEKTLGNVSVEYPKHSPEASRVLQALALLRGADAHG